MCVKLLIEIKKEKLEQMIVRGRCRGQCSGRGDISRAFLNRVIDFPEIVSREEG